MSEPPTDLSGYLAEHVADLLCNAFGTFSLGDQVFRMASMEEADDLDWDEGDHALLICRKSDGALFEAELEATVTPALPRLPEPPSSEIITVTARRPARWPGA